MNDDSERLLTIAECAKRLGITPRALWGWIAAGRLPVVRLSRRATRVRATDLKRFVDDNTSRPESGR